MKFILILQNETCVCFDEHEVVKRESDNASICQECTNQGDCSSYAVVYKGLLEKIAFPLNFNKAEKVEQL